MRRVDTGEAHRLIEVLSPENGLVTALARGARASRRRFAGILEMFATLSLQLQRRGPSGEPVLQSADAKNLRLPLRQSYDAMVRAACLCRCARALTAPGQSAPRLYFLLARALDALTAGRLSDSALIYPYLLKAAGLLPRGSCARCGSAQLPLGLSAQAGCFFCLTCSPLSEVLAPQVVAGLRCDLRPPIDEGLARALEARVVQMIGIHLGRRLPQPAYLE